jgi:hypothetical protein
MNRNFHTDFRKKAATRMSGSPVEHPAILEQSRYTSFRRAHSWRRSLVQSDARPETKMSRLDPQQQRDLSDELAVLIKQQSDARLTEVFVRMTRQEIEAFDLRTQRISQIHVILREQDLKR